MSNSNGPRGGHLSLGIQSLFHSAVPSHQGPKGPIYNSESPGGITGNRCEYWGALKTLSSQRTFKCPWNMFMEYAKRKISVQYLRAFLNFITCASGHVHKYEWTHACMYVSKNTCKQNDQTANKGPSSC